MVEKRILLAVADPSAGEAFRDALGKQWVVTAVTTGTAALAEMRQQPCHVVVADLDLPELDGASLLQQVRKKYPKTIRFILAPENEHNRVMKKVLGGAHQFLAKPLDKLTLKSALEQAEAANVWIPSGKIRELAGRIRVFPTAPSLYFELVNLLKSPDATTEEVGELIGKDMAMMTKLLQVLNSAYFGLPRHVTEPSEAVGILGFEAVKSVVMAVKLLNQYDRLRPAYLSMERLWRHSTDVAQTAKQLTVLATGDRSLAASAFTAGLLHDLGKVVLAANFDEQYSGVHSLARKLHVPLSEIEKEVFGASHGEIGAYLFALWGMPPDLLEAVALHHDPSRSTSDEFSPLTAVHVANTLHCEITPDTEGLVVSQIDEAYLAAIGCLDRLEIWREALGNPDVTDAELRVGAPESVAATPAPAAPEPVPAPPPASEAQPDASAPGPEPLQPGLMPEPAAPVPALEPGLLPPEQPMEVYASDMAASVLPAQAAAPVAEAGPYLPPLKMAGPLRPRPWLYAAAAATLLLLLVDWLAGGLWTGQPQPIRARTAPNASIPAPKQSLAKEKAPASKPSQQVSAPSAAKEQTRTPASATAQAAAAAQAATREALTNKPPESALEQPKKTAAGPTVTGSTAPAAPTNSVTPAPGPQPPPKPSLAEQAFAKLKLQGILFSPDFPSAIVNGKLVHVHDQVAGAVVVGIGPASVTVEFGNQRKTLLLR